MRTLSVIAVLAVLAVVSSLAPAQPLTTAFTYQGELNNGASPATGTYDFRFLLFDAVTAGTQQGSTLCSDNVTVTNGKFTVQMDFGQQFAGNRRFLELQVRQDTGLSCANTAGFTILGPRQDLTAAPNAVFSLTASNAMQLNGQPASFYTNAANLSTGTLPDARLSATVARTSAGQTYVGANTFENPGNIFFGSGGSLTGLNAGNLASGTVPDVRLSTNVATIAGLQTFTGSKTFAANTVFNGTVGIGTAAPQRALSIVGGLAIDQSNQNGTSNAFGIMFGPFSGEGISSNRGGGANPNGLDFFAGSGPGPKMSLTNTGNVGIGTTAPGSLFEVQGSNPQMRLRNTGDQGGSYIHNFASASFFGFYNPGATAWGAVPAGGTKNFFAIQNQGLVTSAVETPPGSGSYVPRNILDDGSGGASFSGSTSIATLNVSGASDFAGVATFHGNTTFSNPVTLSSTASGTSLTLDTAGIATSTGLFQNQINVLRFGTPSGEGITSKRTAGGNQYGLDLYAGQSARLSITNSGNVGIGNTNPGTKLNVRDGMLNVDATSGGGQAQMYISGNHAGNFAALSASNNYVAVMGESQAAPTLGGQMLICNSGGGAIAGLQVTAANQCTLTAQVKNFMVPNPDDAKTDIYYACVEGPEAAMYCRGTARLDAGHTTVDLPRHFAAMAAAQGLTVQVTPLSADCMGIAVTRKSTDSFEVTELLRGQSASEFDWEVKAVRRGYEDYKVIRPAGQLGGYPAPEAR